MNLLTFAHHAIQFNHSDVRGRFAPTPSGRMHIGNLQTALLSWLQVRLASGTFILRIEDLDEARAVPGSTEQIIRDLQWLGLDWDEGPDLTPNNTSSPNTLTPSTPAPNSTPTDTDTFAPNSAPAPSDTPRSSNTYNTPRSSRTSRASARPNLSSASAPSSDPHPNSSTPTLTEHGLFSPYIQSQRSSLYQSAFNSLFHHRHLYPCFCSRREIRESVNAPHGATPVYPGFCRHLSPQAQAYRSRKKDPAWRYRVPKQTITLHDEILGTHTRKLLQNVGDTIIRRADNIYSYAFAVSLDDFLMNITDVVRGQDLLNATFPQIALFQRFLQLKNELPLIPSVTPRKLPRYWHTPLVKDDKGRRMAKRNGSHSIDTLLKDGITAPKLIARLAHQLGLKTPKSLTAYDLLDLLLNLTTI